MKATLLALALAMPVAAQQADAGVPEEELQKELEKAIQADKNAAQQRGQGQGQTAPSVPPAVTTPTDSAGSAPQTLFRGAQSLNPDMSAIFDGNFGYQRRAPQMLSGHDPDLGAQGTSHATGFTM